MIIDGLETYLIGLYGYELVMRLEDIIGIICALLLGHLTTLFVFGYLSNRIVVDRKLNGFSVIRIESPQKGQPDKFHINPTCTIEGIDAMYGVLWVWLRHKKMATFHNIKRLKILNVIIFTLLVILSLIGISLCIHVTDGNTDFLK